VALLAHGYASAVILVPNLVLRAISFLITTWS
jgi:hypothetical protein